VVVVSFLTGCASGVYVVVRAVKDPGWGIGYSVTLLVLSTLATSILALLIFSQIHSFTLDVLPSLSEMVDPSTNVLLAILGSIIGVIIGMLGGYQL